MRMHKWILAVLLSAVSLTAPAQRIMEMYDKPFNIGVHIGFNSKFPHVHSFVIDDMPVDYYRMHYKVAYQAAVLFNFNMNRFFIQPALNWERNRTEIQFILPQLGGENQQNNIVDQFNNSLETEYNSVSIPVLFGYHLVKSGPYGLDAKIGPKAIYHYKTRHECSSPLINMQHQNDNIDYAFNMIAGIGVTIGRLFLDFSYEFGLHQRESSFSYTQYATGKQGNIYLSKRCNTLSFSLGMIF